MENDFLNQVDLFAMAKLMFLSAGGQSEAKELSKELDCPVDASNNKALAPSLLCENILYSSTIAQIKKYECKNILELSCGYSCLGWQLAKEGYNYVGADQQNTAETMSYVTRSKGIKGCKYIAIDYLKEASLFAAADMLDGPITIVTQGLSSSMTMGEKLLALEAIAKVLAYHGGVWILSDLDARVLTTGLSKIINGKVASSPSKKIAIDSLGWQDSKESIPALNSLGFKANAIALNTSYLNPFVQNMLNELDAKEVKDLLDSASMGIIEAGEVPKPDNNLDIYSDLKGTRLFITLVGVLNSDTSPMLLAEFEAAQADGGFASIYIDCNRLRYISSAGLRVLLIMKKSLGDGVLRVKNVNSIVMEVLENTGFDQIVEVK